MNDVPFFSIIIPVYNRSSFIKPAIQSVIDQTFPNWELLIVDDASTDDTVSVIEQYCALDRRIHILKQEYNQERGAARNKGIAHSKGRYICFLDSDDAFCNNHLQCFIDAIEKESNPTMFFTNSYLVVNNQPKTEKMVPALESWNVLDYLLIYTPNPARVCISKSIVMEFQFDPTIPGLEDIDLWLRIATAYPVQHIKLYTNIYNVHQESYSLGDAKRFENELCNFAYIFNKSELQGKLPFWGKRRLLSMCCFHLSQQAIIAERSSKAFSYALRSLFLFPKGYNGKTNKIVMVTMLYCLPIVGSLFKMVMKKQSR
jgi:glycosyltransferase involved in cell wall biosynthesis